MTLDRDDIRALYAKMRVANLVGIPSNQELGKLEDHYLKVLPDGWTRDTLFNAFYEHCADSARGKFFCHPNELIKAHEGANAHKRGGTSSPSSKCSLCEHFGNGRGLLYVAMASPARKPAHHATTIPRVVEGVLPCGCSGGDPRAWILGWDEVRDWHRYAVNAIEYGPERNHQHRLFDRQRALCDRLLA